jgi:hypothetical protein
MVIAADVSKWIGEVLLEDMPGHVAVDIVEIHVTHAEGPRDFARNTFQWHIMVRHLFGETFHTMIPQSDMSLLKKDAVHAAMIRIVSMIAGYLRDRDQKRRLLTDP